MPRHKLTSVALSDGEILDKKKHPFKESRFPGGLTLRFDNETLQRLGIKALPRVGEAMPITGMGLVVGVAADIQEDGSNRSITLQLTDINLGDEDDETLRRINSLYNT